MTLRLKRVGILTGGGDCPGLNAVIRAVVKSALFEHRFEVIGILDGYAGLVENRSRPLSEMCVSDILARGGTILGSSNTANPFQYTRAKKDGSITTEDRSKDALLTFEKLELDSLITIGGDGTQSIALKLAQKGIDVIGIPKTIDNDLDCTDVTFGFDSALTVATEAVDRLHTTGESHKRCMVLEVMGRYAGWIALRSGIAGGGDVILIPEIPYQIEKVYASIQRRIARGKCFSIVVVAEGAKPLGGEMTVQQIVANSADPVRLGGVGHVIAQQIQLKTGLESRATILGHLQRGGIPTHFDRWLATRFGVHALHLIARRQFGRMVTLRGLQIASAPLQDAVSHLRRVDPASEEVRTAKEVGTCFGD